MINHVIRRFTGGLFARDDLVFRPRPILFRCRVHLCQSLSLVSPTRIQSDNWKPFRLSIGRLVDFRDYGRAFVRFTRSHEDAFQLNHSTVFSATVYQTLVLRIGHSIYRWLIGPVIRL